MKMFNVYGSKISCQGLMHAVVFRLSLKQVSKRAYGPATLMSLLTACTAFRLGCVTVLARLGLYVMVVSNRLGVEPALTGRSRRHHTTVIGTAIDSVYTSCTCKRMALAREASLRRTLNASSFLMLLACIEARC